MQDVTALLPAVLAIARQAGERILAVYGEDFAVTTKDDRSPVTAADHAAHATILDGLGQLTPDLPVWSEEAAAAPWEVRQQWPVFWLVDPLDGTREFIRRNGEFTVNIALVRDHRPVLGVVHAPALGRDYWGAAGAGASRADGRGPARAIRVSPPGQPVRICGSRSHRGDSLAGFLAAVGEHVFVPMGSSLKFCLIAEGAADVYPRLGPTSEWDTAAAQAVLEAAGGRVTDRAGRPLRYNTGPGVLNPHFLAWGGSGRDWLGLLPPVATED